MTGRGVARVLPDEIAFLNAVAAAPDDAVVRLVYADWLDGLATPESLVKAAYLRIWCELLGVAVNDLDGYTDRAEELERWGGLLPRDWIGAVNGTRFHLTDPIGVAARAEAFFLRYGGSTGLLDPRMIAIVSTGPADDWEVRYSSVADDRTRWPNGDTTRVAERLAVERATGRVHMISPRGQRFQTHTAHPEYPRDGRRS